MEKLPAGWSYALKPSVLQRALHDAGVMARVSFHRQQKVWERNPPAFSARWYPAGLTGQDAEGAFSIISSAVVSGDRLSAEQFATDRFLPALIEWMKVIEQLPLDSTVKREKQYFAVPGGPLARPATHMPFKGVIDRSYQ